MSTGYDADVKIGDLAARAGVPTKTIRYYEEIGLLPSPPRQPNGYRDYEPTAVDSLRFIKDAQASGLSLAEIAAIVDLRQQGVGTCEHVANLLAKHLDSLDSQIETLRHTRRELERVVARAASLDPAACKDAVRCQTIEEGRAIDGALLHSHRPTHNHD